MTLLTRENTIGMALKKRENVIGMAIQKRGERHRHGPTKTRGSAIGMGVRARKKPSPGLWTLGDGPVKKEAATYSPALHCSTIGAGGLNFSVRDGKRWDPAAITT